MAYRIVDGKKTSKKIVIERPDDIHKDEKASEKPQEKDVVIKETSTVEEPKAVEVPKEVSEAKKDSPLIEDKRGSILEDLREETSAPTEGKKPLIQNERSDELRVIRDPEKKLKPKRDHELLLHSKEQDETVLVEPAVFHERTAPVTPIKEEPVQEVKRVERVTKEVKEKKKKRPLLLLARILFTLVLLLGAGSVVAVAMLPELNVDRITKNPEELGVVSPEDTNLAEEELEAFLEKRGNTLNILIIGVDGVGYDATRSDVMMIMSMNRDTKDVHLVSMQRDTMAYLPVVDRYEKLNHSFAYGGGLATLQAINTNYDLDIEDYIAFDFDALQKLIDRIGGVEVDVSEAEAYGAGLPNTGVQILNGEEALRYVRIRSTAGGDAGRNERQREVLMYVFKYATKMDLKELIATANDMMPLVKTSYDYPDIIPMAKFYDTFRGDTEFITEGFPMDQAFATVDGLAYVIPMTAESNTIALHELLFNFENYKPSDRVIEHSEAVGAKSGLY